MRINEDLIIGNTNKSLSEIVNSLYYKDGDIMDIPQFYETSGYLTSTQKSIQFHITVDKSLKNINKITINNIQATIRHSDGGYIAQSAVLTTIGQIARIYKSTEHRIWIEFVLNTASKFTNNCPVSINIDKATLTFHE